MSAQSLITRRRLLQGASTLIAAPAVLRLRSASAAGVFKIGMVSALTGPLAGFGETHHFVLDGLRPALKGLTNNGKPVEVQIIHKDSQSNPSRAAEVASELILKDQVNLIVTKDSRQFHRHLEPVASRQTGRRPLSQRCGWQRNQRSRTRLPAVPESRRLRTHRSWSLPAA